MMTLGLFCARVGAHHRYGGKQLKNTEPIFSGEEQIVLLSRFVGESQILGIGDPRQMFLSEGYANRRNANAVI
jgi:hypothetical protein